MVWCNPRIFYPACMLCMTILLIRCLINYSHFQGELAHRRVKRRYKRVSKAAPSLGMTHLERREAIMREIDLRVQASVQGASEELSHIPRTVKAPPPSRYYVSEAPDRPIEISHLFRDHSNDPAMKVHCIPIFHITCFAHCCSFFSIAL